MDEPEFEVTVEVSLTEMPHFQRLVQFLEQADRLAQDRDDDELQDLVDATRDDLAHQWE